MNWSTLNDFLAMGGYGPYVWGACGMVFGAMASEVLLVRQRWRHAQNRIRRGRGRDRA